MDSTSVISGIADEVTAAEAMGKWMMDEAERASIAGDANRADALFLVGLQWQDTAHVLRGQAWRAMRPRTGKCYLGRGGMMIGPLRPFRDEEDGNPVDAAGRDAWFFVDGFGGYDRYGRFLSGLPDDHVFDCVSEWKDPQGIEKDHKTELSLLLPAPA